ncbi:hypothetical protein LTR85_003349 [Meristemomyces frigidus]|nr:hypothetical protein LTR85_003349 [Meristemomyces frigidus]
MAPCSEVAMNSACYGRRQTIRKSKTISMSWVQLEGSSSAAWPKGIRNDRWLEEASQARVKLATVWRGSRALREPALIDAKITREKFEDNMRRFSAHESEEYLRELESERVAVRKLMNLRENEDVPSEAGLTTILQSIDISEE